MLIQSISELKFGESFWNDIEKAQSKLIISKEFALDNAGTFAQSLERGMK